MCKTFRAVLVIPRKYQQLGWGTQSSDDCVQAVEVPMETILQLEWKRDREGYQLIKRGGEAIQAPAGSAAATIAGGAGLPDEGGTYVVPRSGNLVTYVINGLNRSRPVSLSLVNASFDRSGEHAGIKKFANEWGLLSSHHDMQLDEFYREIDRIWGVLYVRRYKGAPDLAKQMPALGGISEQLSPDGATVLRKPKTLLNYCLHELLQLIDSGSEFRTCDYCSRFFVARIRGGKRREEHWFCPDPNNRCRKDFHRKGMKEARAIEHARRREMMERRFSGAA
jgi:hypothetical protein